MKKLLLILSLIVPVFTGVYCQTEDISIVKQNRNYYQSGQILTFTDLESILKTFPESEIQIRKCNVNYNIAFPLIIFSSIGLLVGTGIAIASPMPDSITVRSGKDDGFSGGLKIVAVSGALASLGLTFVVAANHHKNKAIRLYNSNLKNTGYNGRQINFFVNSRGMGLRLYF